MNQELYINFLVYCFQNTSTIISYYDIKTGSVFENTFFNIQHTFLIFCIVSQTFYTFSVLSHNFNCLMLHTPSKNQWCQDTALTQAMFNHPKQRLVIIVGFFSVVLEGKIFFENYLTYFYKPVNVIKVVVICKFKAKSGNIQFFKLS